MGERLRPWKSNWMAPERRRGTPFAVTPEDVTSITSPGRPAMYLSRGAESPGHGPGGR
jgi:hypothetical protein